MNIQSYVVGEWVSGSSEGEKVFNAINGESIGDVSSLGIDFKSVVDYARKKARRVYGNLHSMNAQISSRRWQNISPIKR